MTVVQPQADLNRAVLRQINLFKDLPNRALDRLLGSFSLLRYPKGFKVLRQHMPSNNALYLIRSGNVRVMVADSKTGIDRTVTVLSRGEVFGEMEILTGELIAATVETIFDSEFWVLSREDFNAVLFDYPQMAVRLATLLSRRLNESNRRPFLRPTHHVLSVAGSGSAERAAFLSINLAATLARDTRRQTVLLDIDPAVGLMERLIGHEPVRNAAQVLSGGFYLLPDGIDRALKRTPHGFAAMGLKPASEQRASADPSLIPRLLSYLREIYAYVVIHLGSIPDPLTLKSIEQSDMVMRLADGQWPEPIEKLGVPAALSVSLEPGAFKTPADVTVDIRSRTLARFLDAGTPVSVSHPGEDEDRDLSKLSRHARNARIGIALGSGTALGWTHAGVLRVLERERIPIDMISGSSMGACVGALLAMGVSVDDICGFAAQVDQEQVRKLFDYNLPFPRDGLVKGVYMEQFLQNTFGDTCFEDLLIPLRVVATDILNGERVVMKEGLLYKALRASSSIPGIFRMVKHMERFLIDGAVFEPVPARTLRDEGVQRVIAVNCAQPPELNSRYSEMNPAQFNIFDILMRSSEIALYQRNKGHDVRGDVNINPCVQGVGWNELWRGTELIECGEAAAESMLPELKKLVEED